jgi:transcriptional regulator with PAS, ATPase and Fis domain
MLEIVETVNRVAASNVTVLIQGETGSGKEVLAEMIHKKSDRALGPLVKVNCSAIPETLLEAELFGHEKGAFTGAVARKLGRFEVADKGTLFLDEIGDLTLPIQVKLLRVLQDRTFERLGGNELIRVDVRIVAATNRDLRRLMGEGRFREDLYYRINVISIQVPALRDRKEEIPLLVELFMKEFNQKHGRHVLRVTPAAMDLLFNHSWPGNVRELRNCLERSMLLAQGDVLRAIHVQFDAKSPGAGAMPGARVGEAGGRTLPEAAGRAERLERAMPADPGRGRFAAAATPGGDPGEEWERSLNDRQRQLILYLREKGSITNPEYFEMVKVSQRTGLRDLTDLIAKRIIVRHGKTRGCIYRLARRA